MRMHVLGCGCMCWGQGGVSFGTQQCPTPQTRPSQKRLTKKFKNFIFLAVAAASGPRLASSFWTSVGSSNVAIPQSAAAVVVWREGRGRDHSGVQQHQRKQHAVGQQSKPQMQLQVIVRCKLQAVLKQGPCKEPTKQPAAACAGMAWVHRVQSSCELQRTHKHCMLAWINSWHASTPKDHFTQGSWCAAAYTRLGRGCRHAFVNPKLLLLQQLVVEGTLVLLQQLVVVEDGAAHKGPATVCRSAMSRLLMAAAVRTVQRARQTCRVLR